MQWSRFETGILRWIKQPVALAARNHSPVREPVVSITTPLFRPIDIRVIVTGVEFARHTLVIVLQDEREPARSIRRRWHARYALRPTTKRDAIVIRGMRRVIWCPLFVGAHVNGVETHHFNQPTSLFGCVDGQGKSN
jgi:hypothetical protein